MTKLLLASSSSRRANILDALGVPFVARGVDIDETPTSGESARNLVIRLAESKARAGAERYDGPVLGSDTVVVLDGRIFGKPGSEEDGLSMLASLSGRTHQVMTAVALVFGTVLRTEVSVTDVKFRNLEVDEARRYWSSGEPAGKAGAYAIQGLGGAFVEEISGSYTGVVGLPVFETARLLQAAGIQLLPTRESKTE